MPLNFFSEECKTTSNKNKFGLCDEPHPASNPAYIDENNKDNWIGVVINSQENLIEFYAIDHCIKILKADGKMESRCDGLLLHKKQLIFIELKSRKLKGSKWLKDGAKQIKRTIEIFKKNHDFEYFENVEAYVCNQLKPLANQGHAEQLQKFKDETGIILKAQQNIIINY